MRPRRIRASPSVRYRYTIRQQPRLANGNQTRAAEVFRKTTEKFCATLAVPSSAARPIFGQSGPEYHKAVTGAFLRKYDNDSGAAARGSHVSMLPLSPSGQRTGWVPFTMPLVDGQPRSHLTESSDGHPQSSVAWIPHT